jgi:Na+-driven multidrug efflux pump
MLFLVAVGVGFFIGAVEVVGLFNDEPRIVEIAVHCLRVFCIGYVFMAYGMVLSQSLNGAGDTRTPTIINIVCFWMIEIPLAYLLATPLEWGPSGVFWSVAISETLLALISIWVFRLGRWKTVQV